MAKIYLRQGEDIERALKRFGSLVTKEGLQKELKRREYYLSPSQKKRAKREEARKRFMKNEKKRKMREDRLEKR